jgi:hypothetical protein
LFFPNNVALGQCLQRLLHTGDSEAVLVRSPRQGQEFGVFVNSYG